MEPNLEIRATFRDVPHAERIIILIGLPGGTAAIILAFMLLVAPSGLLSSLMWGVVVAVASVLVGLMILAIVVPMAIRLDANGVTLRQGGLRTTVRFADVTRAYAFTDGRQRRVALVPRDGPLVYLGHGLSAENLDALTARLRDVLAARGIDFVEGISFAEVWAREASRAAQDTGRTR